MANVMVMFKNSTEATELMKVLDTLDVKYVSVETTESNTFDVMRSMSMMWQEKCYELAKQLDALERDRGRKQ